MIKGVHILDHVVIVDKVTDLVDYDPEHNIAGPKVPGTYVSYAGGTPLFIEGMTPIEVAAVFGIEVTNCQDGELTGDESLDGEDEPDKRDDQVPDWIYDWSSDPHPGRSQRLSIGNAEHGRVGSVYRTGLQNWEASSMYGEHGSHASQALAKAAIETELVNRWQKGEL